MMNCRSDCVICQKTGQHITEPHFVMCIAYGERVHMAHCLECRYHKYEHSLDWCRYRKGGAIGGKMRNNIQAQELGRTEAVRETSTDTETAR